MKNPVQFVSLTLSSIIANFIFPILSQAQVIPDGTLATEVSPNFEIIQGVTRGSNLFHSFKEFSPSESTTVTFKTSPAIKNIFSRVTGSSPSRLDGNLIVEGQANLFLINPNGIIFGPKAFLELGGSFIGTTAHSVIFADGTVFSATDPTNPPLLTVSSPIGLQFLQTGKSIQVLGNPEAIFLAVPLNQTLALIGGDVILEASILAAPAGQIVIGSVGQGTVMLTEMNQGWAFNYSGVNSFQDIQVGPQSFLTAALFDEESQAQIQTPGTISLSGRQIVLDNQTIIFGNLVQINASQRVFLQNQSAIFTSTLGLGDAGTIVINTPRLELKDFSDLSASSEGGSGQGGAIVINASESILLSNESFISGLTDFDSSGKGGTITINTPQLTLNSGSGITSRTQGLGDGGNIKINATSLEINGRSLDLFDSSGIFANSIFSLGDSRLTKTVGNAGTIEIKTESLKISDGGVIAVNTATQGNGGNLVIKAADVIEVTGSGINDKNAIVPSSISSDSRGLGNAGNLTLEANRLLVQDGATISALARDTGRAGNININANSVELWRGGQISANNQQVNGGNIDINAHDLLLLRQGGQISTNAGEDGGNITLNARFILALPQENSDITANAISGRGGNIHITTKGIFGIEPRHRPTALSDITASSEFGLAGIVNINDGEIEPKQVMQTLPDNLLDAANLIDQALCSAGRGSELTVTGRGGLPSSPQQTLAGDNLWEDWRQLETTSPGAQITPSRRAQPITPETEVTPREFQGWTVNARGNIVLTAAAIVVTPQGDWLPPAGCQHLSKGIK